MANSVVVTGGAIIVERIGQSLGTSLFSINKQEDIDITEFIGSRGLKYLTEATKLSLGASILAKKHAGLDEITPERGGVILATNLASMYHVAEFDLTSLVEGVNLVSPMQGPNLLLNAPAARLGIHHKLSGFNTTIAAGRAGALDAVEYAYHSIMKGEVDVCIVGGVEEKTSYYLNWFIQAGLVSENNLEQINQGGGVIVLESKEHAESRGAKIYGELCEFAGLFDANSLIKGSRESGLEENYEFMVESLVKDKDYNIQFVSMADNQLDGTTDAEKALLAEKFPEASLISHYSKFGGELNSGSGIVQLLASLNEAPEGYGIAFNYDWFGNYRSLLFQKR